MNRTFLVTLLLTICMLGCKKEETPPATQQPTKDPRDQAVGTYSGFIKTKTPAGVHISTQNISVKVSKNSSDNSRIDAFDATDPTVMMFYGINIRDEGSSGLGFYAPKQLEDIDGYATGFPIFPLGSNIYDGVFRAEKKEIALYFKLYDDTNTHVGNAVFELYKNP